MGNRHSRPIGARKWSIAAGVAALTIFAAVAATNFYPILFAKTEPVPEADILSADMLLLAYMKPLGLLPIAVPRGQKVGSVFTVDGAQWLDDADVCFPGLTVRRVSSHLDPIETHQDFSLNATLGLTKMVSGSTGGTNQRTVKITFPTVEMEAAPIGALRQAFAADKCPYLKDMFGNQPVTKAPYWVVSEVYFASRTVEVTVTTEANAKAEAKLVPAGNGVDVHVGPAGGTRFSIVAVNTNLLPVAARIAFLPSKNMGLMGGAAKGDAGLVWSPFDPKENLTQAEEFSRIADLIGVQWQSKAKR